MKPKNLYVFYNMTVKLRDFGASLKFPDKSQGSDILSELNLKIKGLTNKYSLDKIKSAFANGDDTVTIDELYQNDYYGLYKTFKKVLTSLKDHLNS